MQISDALPLNSLPVGHCARVAAVDWARLEPSEARRLREFGLYEGVEVEVLHRGTLFFRDPLALRIGRMRVAVRAVHAAVVTLDSATVHVSGTSVPPASTAGAAAA